MIGVPHGLAAEVQIDRLVIHRGVRQTQWDQVMKGYNVWHALGPNRQWGRPVHDIGRRRLRCLLKGQWSAGAIGRNRSVRVSEKGWRRPEAIGGRTSSSPAWPNDFT